MDQERKTSKGEKPEKENGSFIREAWGFIKVFVITAAVILLFVRSEEHTSELQSQR